MKTTKEKPIRTKRISAALTRSIALILILTIFVPVVAYYILPDWVYYLTAATQLWFAETGLVQSYDAGNFSNAVRDTEMRYNTNVEVYSKDGDLIYSTIAVQTGVIDGLSPDKPLDAENYATNYDIIEGTIKPGGWGYLLKEYVSNSMKVTFLDSYMHTANGDRIELTTQVSQTTTISKIEILVTFIAIMLSLMIAFFLIIKYIKKFMKPIHTMVHITDRMSRLNFSEKCPPVKYEELENLSKSINDMSVSLDSALTELKEKNEKLKIDIENEKTIDELRKTFISGISHELKTPIAIIQGYAEGAKAFYAAGNAELADSYCDTIAAEADRMNNMIMKLLEITKYDSGAYEPLCEDFNICDEVQDWFERNSSILAEKNITPVNNIQKDILVNGDRFLLSSVINNYLSNALSHVEGEMIITTYAEVLEDKVRVYIENTGTPIADKDIDKIWTSFYRADKSLSRKQGRFGLGLAIVASIQRLHQEGYGVENTENGVRFYFDTKLPQGENK